MPCILCGTTENLTVEHVFPAFTGANLTVANGTCLKCNGESSAFEDRLANETETARNIFAIPNRYGQVPSARVSVNVMVDGTDVVTLPGRRNSEGQVDVFDFVKEIVSSDGRKVREGFFVTEAAAVRFIERHKAKQENVTDLGAPKDVEMIPVSQQKISFAFGANARRTVAKITMAALAYQYGVEYACSKPFDSLRQSIFGDAASLPVRIFANENFAAAHIRTPHQHSVLAHLSAGMHKGWALVTLFGGLSYAVELTRELGERESRSFSLFYDVELQSRFSPVILANEYVLVGEVLSPRTVFETPEAVDAQWYKIVEKYCGSNGIELSRIEISDEGLQRA